MVSASFVLWIAAAQGRGAPTGGFTPPWQRWRSADNGSDQGQCGRVKDGTESRHRQQCGNLPRYCRASRLKGWRDSEPAFARPGRPGYGRCPSNQGRLLERQALIDSSFRVCRRSRSRCRCRCRCRSRSRSRSRSHNCKCKCQFQCQCQCQCQSKCKCKFKFNCNCNCPRKKRSNDR